MPVDSAQVEHVFAGQKHWMGLVVRTIGIACRATIKIGMANLAYNFQLGLARRENCACLM